MNFLHILVYLWYSTEALHVTQFFRLEQERKKMLLESVSEYPEDDPLDIGSIQMRQAICDKVIKSKHYTALSKDMPIPPPDPISEGSPILESQNLPRVGITATNPNPDYLKCCRKQVHLDFHGKKTTVILKLIECTRNEEGDRIFVKLTSQDDKMLLIGGVKWGKNKLTLRGILDPRPEYNINFQGLEGRLQLHHYFAKQVKSDYKIGEPITQVPRKMTLHMISFMDHARVCSAAFEALSHPNVGFFQEDVRQDQHFIHIKSDRRCLHKSVLMEAQEHKRLILAVVLPCAINRRYPWSQFFVLTDYRIQGAAFILTNMMRGVNTLQLVARLTNVAVLSELGEYGAREDNN